MAFLLMVMNPYLLDFFGLARGYGLSIGFMIMSLYFLLDYVSEKKKLSLVFYNIGAILSVLGNFSLLYYYAASLLVLNLFILIQEGYGFLSMRNKTNFLSLNYINLFFVLLLSVLIYNPISKIISARLVVFGGKAGFVEDTVSSLLTQMSYGYIWDPILLKVIAISVVLFVLLLSIFLIFKIFLKQYQKENYSKLILVNFILLFTALGSYINHHFFGTDFLKERFALFLVPLLIVNIGVFLDHIFNNGYEKGALLIGGILNLIFLVNFLNNANLTHTHDWKYDMHTKEALKWVVEDHHKTLSNSAEKIKLANYWIFEPSLNFYRKTWDLNWLKPFDREGINIPADYYYSFQKKLPVDFIEDCTEVMKFPEPETILLKAKVKN
jgi:hypothetical protein